MGINKELFMQMREAELHKEEYRYADEDWHYREITNSRNYLLNTRNMIEEYNIQKSDINYQLAYDAYRNISFSPEKRAEQEQNRYVQQMEEFIKMLESLAETDLQKSVMRSEVERFKQGYIKHINAVLSAKSRCASTMITGPANFNVRRNEKANRAEENRRKELSEWLEKATRAAKRNILDARNEQQVQDAEWEVLKREIVSSASTIIGIDIGQLKGYARPLFVSSLQGRIERCAKNGKLELVRQALDFIRTLQEKHTKPIFAKKNRVWKLAEKAEAVIERQEERLQEGITTIATIGEVEIVDNPEIDRVQIFFPQKPAAEVIAALKKEAWNWSPSAGAWQRKTTGNARNSAVSIVNRFYSKVEA